MKPEKDMKEDLKKEVDTFLKVSHLNIGGLQFSAEKSLTLEIFQFLKEHNVTIQQVKGITAKDNFFLISRNFHSIPNEKIQAFLKQKAEFEYHLQLYIYDRQKSLLKNAQPKKEEGPPIQKKRKGKKNKK